LSGALAVHPGALGDVLLAVPALRALRERHGRVMLAAQPRIADLLTALTVVDEACAIDRLRLDALFIDGATRAELFGADRVVCWLGARDPAFARRLSAQAPSVTVAPSVGEGIVWQHLLRTAVPGAVPRVDPVVVPAAIRETGRAALREAGWNGESRLLFFHPGAGSAGKVWPVEGFASVIAAVASERQMAVVVHQGPADAAPVASLASHLQAPLMLNEPALPALAGALWHATAFVGNDSGVSHLAGAVGAAAVVLFAPSNLAWQSWSATSCIVRVTPARMCTQEAADVIGAVAAALQRPRSHTTRSTV
jgi:heptosyltransferase III